MGSWCFRRGIVIILSFESLKGERETVLREKVATRRRHYCPLSVMVLFCAAGGQTIAVLEAHMRTPSGRESAMERNIRSLQAKKAD